MLVMGEQGVGGLTVSEIARRMGIRGPSLYKYFPSLHAVYDALFARGVRGNAEAVREALDSAPPGLDRIRAGVHATVRWCLENQPLAQLLYWRPVPAFEPSPESFAASVEEMGVARAELADAVRRCELHESADSDDALRLLTILMSGLISQQMANEPDAGYRAGLFARLTDDVLDMFLAHYAPTRRS